VIASEKRAEAGQRVQADEDEHADAGGQEPRQQHQREHRSAEAGGLEQQEGAEQRGAEQRADCGEAAGGRDHGRGGRRGIARGQAYGQHAQPAAYQDQRGLGAEHDAEAKRCEGGEQDAGELDRWRCACRLEPVGGRVPARAREVANRGRHQQAGEREQG